MRINLDSALYQQEKAPAMTMRVATGNHRVYFSLGTTAYGFADGKYAHFYYHETNNTWYTYANDDDRGFPLSRQTGEKAKGILLNNTALVRLLIRMMKLKDPAHLRLRPTGIVIEGLEKELLVEIEIPKDQTRHT
jgi:hypothetical protein